MTEAPSSSHRAQGNKRLIVISLVCVRLVDGRSQRRRHSSQLNTKFFKAAGFRFILAKTRFSVDKHEDESGAWQQRVKLPITVATLAKLIRLQSSVNGIEDLSKVCQTFCLLEQKVQQACQTCQTCRFRNWVVNQTQIPSYPSLPFSELIPIKHTSKGNVPTNRPFSYSTKESGSSDIFIHFIREVRSSGVRAPIAIVHIRKFFKM